MSKIKIYQSDNLAKIEHFFSDKVSTLHFLLLLFFFSIILVVFIQPVWILGFTTQLSSINPHIQVILSFVAGLIVVVVSRVVLFALSSRRSFLPMEILVWLLVELVVTITFMTIVMWLVSGCGHLQLAYLAGDLLLLTVSLELLPYLIAGLEFRLRESRAEVSRLQSILDSLQSDGDGASSLPYDRIVNFYDKGNRLVFSVSSLHLLYIEAADNYTNIHYMNEGKEDTFILHNSMKELEKMLHDTSLLRCHRGYMVNLDNVKLLRKEGSQLLLELTGISKVIPVTKTYASAVTGRLAPRESIQVE